LSCCLFKPPLRYGESSVASCLCPILSGISGFKISHVEGFKSLSAADKRTLVATLDEALPATPPREEFQMKRLQTPSNVPRVGARVSMLFDDGQKYPVRFHSREQPHHIAHSTQRITRTTFNITHSKTYDNNNNNNSTLKRTSQQAGKTSHTHEPTQTHEQVQTCSNVMHSHSLVNVTANVMQVQACSNVMFQC
jgi:hypothetical protein